MKLGKITIEAEQERGHKDGRGHHSYNPIISGSIKLAIAYRNAFISGRSEDGKRGNEFAPESVQDEKGKEERTFV